MAFPFDDPVLKYKKEGLEALGLPEGAARRLSGQTVSADRFVVRQPTRNLGVLQVALLRGLYAGDPRQTATASTAAWQVVDEAYPGMRLSNIMALAPAAMGTHRTIAHDALLRLARRLLVETKRDGAHRVYKLTQTGFNLVRDRLERAAAIKVHEEVMMQRNADRKVST